jgi:hypothetical protein
VDEKKQRRQLMCALERTLLLISHGMRLSVSWKSINGLRDRASARGFINGVGGGGNNFQLQQIIGGMQLRAERSGDDGT